MVRKICLLLIVGVLSVSACGSSSERSPEPQKEQAMLQGTIDTLQATLDASDSSDTPTKPATAGAAPRSQSTSVPDSPLAPHMSDQRVQFSSSPIPNDTFDSQNYVVDVDGSELVSIPEDPSWSPTGNELAYVVDDGSKESVFLANPFTGEFADLTKAMTYTQFSKPIWSPDGSNILYGAFAATNSGVALTLIVGDRTGSGATKVIDISGGLSSDPSWSPDGSLIGFAGPLLGARVIGPDGSNEVCLTCDQDIGWVHRIYWSPDGQRILLETYANGPTLYVTDRNGGNLVKLLNPEQEFILENFTRLQDVAWAPDGRHVAFIADRSDPSNVPGEIVRELKVARADGRPASWTYAVEKWDPRSAQMRYAWSPDGKLLAFNSAEDGNPEVYVVSPGEDEVKNLSRNLSRDELPRAGTVWSPDGDRVLFLSQRTGVPQIHIADVQGQDVILLTEYKISGYQTVSWSNNGRYIVFESNAEGNDEIYLADLKELSVRNLTNSGTTSESRPQWVP